MTTYNRFFPHVTGILDIVAPGAWSIVIVDSNRGPVVIIGGEFEDKVKADFQAPFSPYRIPVVFCSVEEMSEDGVLARATEEG